MLKDLETLLHGHTPRISVKNGRIEVQELDPIDQSNTQNDSFVPDNSQSKPIKKGNQ